MVDEDALDFRLDLETLWDTRQAFDNRFERFLADSCRLGLARVLRLKDGRGFSELCFLVRFAFFDRVHFIPRHFETQSELGLQRSSIVFAECSGIQQLAFVKLRDGW